MAPKSPTLGAPRRSRGAPRSRWWCWGPDMAPKPPTLGAPGGAVALLDSGARPTRGCGDVPASCVAPREPSARRCVGQGLARALRYGPAERGRRVGGPAGAGDENQATEKTMTTNVQSTHTKNELLRELVIAIGCLAMLLSGV